MDGLIWIFILLIILLVLAIAISSYYSMQYYVLFNPDTVINSDLLPNEEYQDIVIRENNYNINAWYFKRNPNSVTILYCHGNVGNISHRDYVIGLSKRLDINLFIFDYRGYGYSGTSYNPNNSNNNESNTFKPTQNSILVDGEVAFNYLCKDISHDKIIVWGESLGGAVATHIAQKSCQINKPCKSLVLLSTFSSLDDIIRDSCLPGVFKYPFATIVSLTFNTLPNKDWISNITCPILLIHSENDTLINIKSSERLYNNISHDHKILIKIDGDHSSPKINELQMELIYKFIRHDNNRTRNCKLFTSKQLKNILQEFENASENFRIQLGWNKDFQSVKTRFDE